MTSRIFVVTSASAETVRIRAARFDRMNLGDGHWMLQFFRGAEKEASATITVMTPYSVIPMDMLFDSMTESLMLPPVAGADQSDEVEFLSEPLFTEEDKIPFTPEQRRMVVLALEGAKEEIQRRFETSKSQQDQIDKKLDYLADKVTELDKFNWKRLFISTLVGVAVDLSFGTFVPASLLAVFTEVLSHFGEGAVKRIAGERPRGT